ncbi:hypothetical protein [Bradyrhizobium sp. CER78]|uniref:hypothetical protein n=1 Tax=Bradyrhizobium sp. CER78 TaxID=3039162 RepID=UPI00244C0A62|nr:hypothetical protein [Bradyrhizobium sp. CER78]MDH2384969.1 hypothetical protein [Bradyrhizobium sp. CER78]
MVLKIAIPPPSATNDKTTAVDARRSAELIDIFIGKERCARRGRSGAHRIRLSISNGDEPVNLTNLQTLATLLGVFFGLVALLSNRLPSIGALRRAAAPSAVRRRQQAMTTSGHSEQKSSEAGFSIK